MLRWRQSIAESGTDDGPSPGESVEEQACPGMARALQRVLSKENQPEVLDLGQFSRSAAVYLATRGARVTVDNFAPPAPQKKSAQGGDGAPSEPLVLAHADRRFDLVLAWEHADFCSPDRLGELATEVARVMAPGGWLLLYARDTPGNGTPVADRPACYKLTADDRMQRVHVDGPERDRWTHPNRAIERALTPLSVQSIHLQRNRMREILLRKAEETR